jgi:myotubularin-related protein 1/2
METWQKSQAGVGLLFFNLMKDQNGVVLLRDFLKIHNAEASLAFYLDVQKFKGCVSDEKRNPALEIYKKYLVTQAPSFVSIPPHLKLEIDSVISNPDNSIPLTLFDKAAADVAEKIQEDSFKRFIRTPQYEEYQQGKEARSDVGVMLCKLPGEALVHKPLRVLFYDSFTKAFVSSSLYITNYRLTFGNFSNAAKATDLELLDEICALPLGCIQKITRSQQKEPLGLIEIHCKDFRKVEFQIDANPGPSPLSPINTKSLKRTIKSLCFPRSATELFAYYFKPTWSERKDWQRYNIYEEFLRQGISFENWRFTDINHDYSMCESYPSRFIVPVSISDEQLTPVFGYRSRGRIPILCWCHPITGASISRSSQPNSGVLRARCPEDEALLKAIGETGGNTRTLYLLDARPRANALGNTVKGKGFENVGSYSNCKIEFLGIANIHAMRESLQKLEALALSGNEDQWLAVLDGTKWMDHIRDIFVGTMRSVELVEQGYPVLLHCSDGWDRTAQLSSLSLLLLDSYYRTISGFIVLVEKEWLASGHRFLTRVGHGAKSPSDQNAPIFLQFLDCVYQITLQFGCSFEFNEHFLLTIAHHLYSCQFGTFLFDCDLDRQQNQLAAKTTSLWSYIHTHQHEFQNPFYMPDSNVLKLDVHMSRLEFWSGLYTKWVRKSATNIVTTEMRGMMLKSMNDQMAKRLKDLEKELNQLRQPPPPSPSSISPLHDV